MTVINVRGSASDDVAPDYASVACSCSSTADDAATAQARASAIADALRAAVTDAPGVRSLTLSRVSVHEVTRWNDKRQETERTGWQATLSGVCEVDADQAGATTGLLVGAGAEVGYLNWLLDRDNPAQRRVRAAAVADARRAADDFAEAVGGVVGELLTLADPGLLGGGPGEAAPRAASTMLALDAATAKGMAVSVDPGTVTVFAAVEASYTVVDVN